jgi:hypothetical protein
VADSAICSVKLESSSKQVKPVMGIGHVRMSLLKHARQSTSSSAGGLGNRLYFSMIMQQSTRSDHLMLFQQPRCPGGHSDGSPALAQGCVMGDSPMARLSHCITLIATQTFLDSSKVWNRSYANMAFTPPIDF